MLSYKELTKSLSKTIPKNNLSTGIALLDNALIDGLPKGKIIELSGPSDSGKTAFALQLIQEIQKQNGIAIFANIDNNINIEYVKYTNIDKSKLYLYSSNNLDLLIAYIKDIAKTNSADLIIIDSITNLISDSELKSSMTKQNNSLNYNLVKKMLSEISLAISGTNICVLCINQYRAHKSDSNFIVESAWKKLFKLYATVRMTLKKNNYIIYNDVVIGFDSKITITENKLNNNTDEILFPIHFTRQVK